MIKVATCVLWPRSEVAHALQPQPIIPDHSGTRHDHAQDFFVGLYASGFVSSCVFVAVLRTCSTHLPTCAQPVVELCGSARGILVLAGFVGVDRPRSFVLRKKMAVHTSIECHIGLS